MPRALTGPVVSHAFDLGHVPLFAAVTLAAFALARGHAARRAWFALAIATALAGGAELLQAFIPTREASVDDFVRGVGGEFLALAGIASWRRSREWRFAFALLSSTVAAVLLWSVADKVRVVQAFDRQMPTLASFEHDWELGRWHAKPGTTIVRSRDFHADGGWSLAVQCSRDVYPGVSIEGFKPDWRSYRLLTWSAFVPGTTALELTLRIDDDLGERYGTRFVAIVPLQPGAGTYHIDLDRVARALPAHRMNLAQITEVHFFLDHPDVARAFFLDAVQLEP